MRFSLTEVRVIMSDDHFINTRSAIGHMPDSEELIQHYLEHHIVKEVVHFQIETEEQQQREQGTDLSDPLFIGA